MPLKVTKNGNLGDGELIPVFFIGIIVPLLYLVGSATRQKTLSGVWEPGPQVIDTGERRTPNAFSAHQRVLHKLDPSDP